MLTALICPPWPPSLLALLASLSPIPEPSLAAAWVAGVVVVVVEPSE